MEERKYLDAKWLKVSEISPLVQCAFYSYYGFVNSD